MTFVPQSSYRVMRVLRFQPTFNQFNAEHRQELLAEASSIEQAGDLARLDRQNARALGQMKEGVSPQLVAHEVVNAKGQLIERIVAR